MFRTSGCKKITGEMPTHRFCQNFPKIEWIWKNLDTWGRGCVTVAFLHHHVWVYFKYIAPAQRGGRCITALCCFLLIESNAAFTALEHCIGSTEFSPEYKRLVTVNNNSSKNHRNNSLLIHVKMSQHRCIENVKTVLPLKFLSRIPRDSKGFHPPLYLD